MHDFKKILVGIDFDEEANALSLGSRTAARQAFWMAQRTGAQLEFVHSTFVDPESGIAAAAGPVKGLEDDVEAIRKECCAELRVALTVVEERPWVALTQMVLAGKGDLVIVAKRNHSKRDDRRLGSVSIQLIRNCPAPVWVVKPEHELTHRCVVAATDLSNVGDIAADYGAFIAKAEECPLYVVHAWQMPMELQLSASRMSPEEAAGQKQAIIDAARQHIRALPAVAALGDKAKVLLACDTPSHAVLGAVKEKQPDLVVMGTISRGGIAGLVVGNTAEKLLYQLDCSLLTVKPDDFVSPVEK